MKDQVVRLDLSDVQIKDHLSRTKLDISSLAESIESIGQINPITVKKIGAKYQVIAGRRRFTALKHIEATSGKKQQVLVVVKDLDQVQEELIEIDENLMRQDLNESEYDEALYRRKQLYEQLHPETKKSVAGGHAKHAKNDKSEKSAKPKVPFTEDAAKKLGTSRRTVEKAIARASKASDKVKKAREDGSLSPSKVDLLVTLDHKDQDILLPIVKDLDVSEVKDLLVEVKKHGAKAVALDLEEVKKEDPRLKPLIRDAVRLSEAIQEALENRLTLEGDSKHYSLKSLDELEKRIQKFTSFQRAALGYVKAIVRRGDEKKVIRQQVQR
jgi:ParB/RepB/Spo0J family partition protein